MNQLESLFNFDERLVVRRRKKEALLTALYSLIDIRQWRYIRRWIESNRSGSTPYVDEIPWITYRAISFLNKNLNEKSVIFEYGSGGSTLYFSKRAHKLISVEHDSNWYKVLKKELKDKKVKNCTYLEKPPKKAKDPLHEYFSSWREQGVSFKDYVMSIEEFPDNYFDLVSVDGRARVACVRQAYNKVKEGGFILLDNSERRDYFGAHLFMRDKGCVPMHFFGLVGYETPLSQTTIWKVKK